MRMLYLNEALAIVYCSDVVQGGAVCADKTAGTRAGVIVRVRATWPAPYSSPLQ